VIDILEKIYIKQIKITYVRGRIVRLQGQAIPKILFSFFLTFLKDMWLLCASFPCWTLRFLGFMTFNVFSTKIVYFFSFRGFTFLHPSFLHSLMALALFSVLHDYFLWFLHCLSRCSRV
jgi:hypothetical protein